tara:strand:+ start:1120 stop:1332 length:213 start_codon:yes stop_codon:yes gene_type:complete
MTTVQNSELAQFIEGIALDEEWMASDQKAFRDIANYLRDGELVLARHCAGNQDTIIRGELPQEFWNLTGD